MMKDTTGANAGQVLLIGAGPGDPELLTRGALLAMQRADVVVYDRLVSPEIMGLVPEDVLRIDVGKAPGDHKLTQEETNTLLIDLARRGMRVARLKGGDPLIFGRGSEEAAELHKAGVAFEYLPGITSAQGAAAATGVPLTHRGLATGVRYVTGHRAKDAPLNLDWASLSNEDTTLVVYMGAMNIADITSKLIRHGMASSLPVMAVSAATTPRQKQVFSDLGHIAETVGASDLDAPLLFVIGHVVTLNPVAAQQLASGTKDDAKAVAYG
ncbi:uroporphyrinogen-III C-methyltransferase [uncultured Pelagimonas sp.]|uniref:uroporphyrinogen-III C-methyltransferase n=1 Tax=uncultured Pelagimonas sp. TaxID=1618102 RepID=UPI0034592D9D